MTSALKSLHPEHPWTEGRRQGWQDSCIVLAEGLPLSIGAGKAGVKHVPTLLKQWRDELGMGHSLALMQEAVKSGPGSAALASCYIWALPTASPPQQQQSIEHIFSSALGRWNRFHRLPSWERTCPSPGLPPHGSANSRARTRAEGLGGTQGGSCPAFNSMPPSCSRILVKMSYLMLSLMKFYDEKLFSEGRRGYFKTIIQIFFWSDTF